MPATTVEVAMMFGWLQLRHWPIMLLVSSIPALHLAQRAPPPKALSTRKSKFRRVWGVVVCFCKNSVYIYIYIYILYAKPCHESNSHASYFAVRWRRMSSSCWQLQGHLPRSNPRQLVWVAWPWAKVWEWYGMVPELLYCLEFWSSD